jgi:hypothetical protein
MHTLELNGRDWQSQADFYDALAIALGSIEWHGRNAAAFEESMIYYLYLNTVQPPYEVIIRGASEAMRPFLMDFASWVEEARTARKDDPDWGDDVDVRVIVS